MDTPGVRRAIFAIVALWSALGVWQWVEQAKDRSLHRKSLELAGEASVGMLDASLRSVGRARKERPEFLGAVFDEVAKVPGIRGAWIVETGGRVLVSRGVSGPPSVPEPYRGPVLHDHGVLVGRAVDLEGCLFDGEGRPRTSESLSQPTFLFFCMDRASMDRELAAHLRLRIAVQALAGMAALGASLALRGRARARRLRMELAVSEERSSRLRELAALAAGLAHETKNPLSLVRGMARRLADEEPGDSVPRRSALAIVDEVDRVVARINEFLQFSRPADPCLEAVDLRALFEQLAHLIESDLEGSGGRLLIEGEPLVVRADHGMLRQIILNLLVNAARALGPAGTIRLRAYRGEDASVGIEVADDGRGISTEATAHVFEPYYTASPGGTGLGLAIVERLARAQGWRIGLSSREGAGTTVRIEGVERIERVEEARP